jgi:hypothetical protein
MRKALRALVASMTLPAALHAQIVQQPFAERQLAVPVAPGAVAPWRPAMPAAADPRETGSLHVAPTGPTLADWYQSQGRPALVLLFDRRSTAGSNACPRAGTARRACASPTKGAIAATR